MEAEIYQAIADVGEEKDGLNALRILFMSAYFAPAKNIHLDMFSPLQCDSEELNAATQLLKRKSLVESHDKDTAFVIKKSTQKAIRGFLKHNSKEKETLMDAIWIVTYHLVHDDIHPNYVDHALSLTTHVIEWRDLVKASVALPNLIVNILRKRNRLQEAKDFGRIALNFLQEALGEGHGEALALQHSLATVLDAEGQHGKAAKVLKDLQEKDVKYSTKKQMRKSLVLQAKELCELSKYQEALQLYHTLLGEETVFDAFSDDYLTAWDDYASLLNDMGPHSEAVDILEDCLIQQKKVLKPDDENWLAVRLSLSHAYMLQGKYNKANKHLKEAIFEGKENFGELHPDTLRAERDMGILLLYKGDYDEALLRLENVEKKFKLVLPESHPEFLCTQANIIAALMNLEKYDRALQLSKDVHEAYRNTLGENHKEALQVKNNIGSIYLRQGRITEAVKIFQEVYGGFYDVFGPEHYSTMEVRGTLELLGCFPQTTKDKYKTLHSAVQRNDLNKVVNLIKENVDVNEEDFAGRRPLHYAALNGHVGIVKYLLKMGAMHDAVSFGGETSLQLASGNPVKNLLISIRNLFKDVKKGNQTNFANHIEMVNVKDKNGYSLLHWAVYSSQKSTVQKLLNADADPRCVSLKGNTPLHIAASKGLKEIAEILLRSVRRGDLNDFVNSKTTEKGNAALHVAAKNNDLELVKCLLRHGAHYDIFNGEGEIPVQLSSAQSILYLLNMVHKLFSDIQKGNCGVVFELKSMDTGLLLDVTSARNSQGLTLFQVAAINKHRYIAEELSRLLKDLNVSEVKQN